MNEVRSAGSQESRRPTASDRIREIEGLRGIALTLVVAFHLFANGRVSGGVDVFLVISAFLLTRSMFRKSTQPSGVRLVEHFAGVAARLVPSAVVVLAFVATITIALLPQTSQHQNLLEVLASALYFENWELIISRLSYGAAGPDSSALQHFWSLAIQGQFFLIWPFVIVALVGLATKRRISPAHLVGGVTLVLTAISGAYATWLTGVDQSVAYFSSFSRFWELGVGAAAALLLPHLTMHSRLRIIFAWTGLLLIISCGFVLDGARLFPGVWTLWPVIGTILVLSGAGSPSPPGPGRLLDTPLLRWIALISYPLYLWHWPLLIFYLQLRDQQAIGWRGGALVLGVSVLLAWLTVLLVESPISRVRHRASGLRLLAVPVALLAVIVIPTSATVARLDAQQAAELEAASKPSAEHIGALALTDSDPSGEVAFIPSVGTAANDLPPIYADGCVQNWRNEPDLSEVLICESTVERPSRTIVMSGGSHTLQWYPALKAVAVQENWAILVVDKDGCRLLDPLAAASDEANEANEACLAWNAAAVPRIIDLDPDAVFTVGTLTAHDGSGAEVVLRSQITAWSEFDKAGIPVIAVRDTPRFDFNVPECVAENSGDPNVCGTDRPSTYSGADPLDSAGLPESVVAIDLSEGFCISERCPPVIGNVLVYRDDDHMTATYARTLAPALRGELERGAPWLF